MFLCPFKKSLAHQGLATTEPPQQHTEQDTPSSTIPFDNKKIVSFFLNHPSAIASYHLRVTNLIQQNAVESMYYIDDGETAPTKLVEERKALLDMNKAYAALDELCELYQTTIAKKKNIARKIFELWNIGTDAIALEEQSSVLSREIQEIEREASQLLHTSGAIKDGLVLDLKLMMVLCPWCRLRRLGTGMAHCLKDQCPLAVPRSFFKLSFFLSHRTLLLATTHEKTPPIPYL